MNSIDERTQSKSENFPEKKKQSRKSIKDERENKLNRCASVFDVADDNSLLADGHSEPVHGQQRTTIDEEISRVFK